MALEYGFGRFENDPTAQKIWKRKFETLSETDKEFFHEFLPAILIMTDVGCINEDTIPHPSLLK